MRKNKKNLMFIIIILFAVALGIGYAVLTEKLTINNTVSYDAMKWDVGFVDIKDYSAEYIEYNEIKFPTMDVKEVLYAAPAVATISEDKKGISFACDIGKSTKMIMCVVVATIKNDSTFDVEIESIELSSDNQEEYDYYKNELSFANSLAWFTSLEEAQPKLKVGDVLKAGETKQIIASYSAGSLSPDNLPENGATININMEVNWIEKTN